METLPETIGNLKSLRIVYFGRNNLTTLPDSVRNLTSLRVLNLLGNQIKVLHKSVLQSMNESLEEHKEISENKLNLEELKRIRNILERLEKEEK